MEKLCIKCRHHRKRKGEQIPHICVWISAKCHKGVDLVTGKTEFLGAVACKVRRNPGGSCGTYGKLFSHKSPIMRFIYKLFNHKGE